MIALVDKGGEWFITHFKLFDVTETWESETFFVSGLLSNGVEMFDNADDDNTL